MPDSGNNKRIKNGPDVHLNLNIRGMPRSPTVAINEHCDELRRQGREIFKLGLGQSPFPVPQPVVDALKVNASRKDYLAVQGLYGLRETVAEYHHRRHRVNRSGDDVLIGPGSKELMFLLQVVYYGELVLPTPAWVSYAPQAQIVGRNIRFLHTSRDTGWLMSPRQVEDLCAADPSRPRILVLNYPSNPTGATYKLSELKEIAATARKYGLILLSDEIYGELHYRGQHVSIARFYPEGTIISTGLSKWCGAGGWRLGTFTFPAELRWLLEGMASVASETFTSTSAPIQYAAVRAFRGGIRIEEYLWRARRILAALAKSICSRFEGAEVPIIRPAGAFYLFPDFTELREKLAAKEGDDRDAALHPAAGRDGGGNPSRDPVREGRRRAHHPARLRRLRRNDGPGCSWRDPLHRNPGGRVPRDLLRLRDHRHRPYRRLGSHLTPPRPR